MDYNIIIDTREQLPIKFIDNVVRSKLDVGDYACEINGKRLKLVFERKSPNDLLGTLTRGHKRFNKELERANKQGIRVIVIVECSYEDFIDRKYEGARYSKKIHNDYITKILHGTLVSHDLEIIFFNNRRSMGIFILNTFEALARESDKRGKARARLLKKFKQWLS